MITPLGTVIILVEYAFPRGRRGNDFLRLYRTAHGGKCSFANVSAATTLHRLCEIIERLYRAELTVHSRYIWLEC